MSPAVDPAVHTKPADAKKLAVAPRNPSGHPPFAEMINDAIVVLKERNGSSQVAIQKFIEEKYKHLPATFRKLLLVQLKRMVASGKLVRVKHSFQLNPSSKPVATKPKPKVKESALAAKPKAKGEAATKEKKSNAAATKKRKAAEKPVAKLKPAAVSAKAARTLKKMISPGNKAAKPKKTTALKKVKLPMKKATPKRVKPK